MSTFAEKKWGDCSKAVAYNLNFVQMCYMSGSRSWSDFYNVDCSYCESPSSQKTDFEYPKGKFVKKDYYILDELYFGVSENLRNDMIKYGAGNSDFRPIYSAKRACILGYQVVPENVLPPIYQVNKMTPVVTCKKCGRTLYEYGDDTGYHEAYDGFGYPYYLTQEACKSLKPLNRMFETKEEVIISLDMYNNLIRKYPKLECRPVFLGSVYTDREYIRLHNYE